MKLARIAVIATILAGTFGVSTAGANMGVPLTSSNWSGYIAQARPGYKLNYAYTYFKVPTLDCAATRGKTATSAQASNNGTVIWGGIDGVSLTQDVEQSGVWLWCDKYSHPHYQAFWEMAPAPPHYFWNVHPGDIIASVTQDLSPNHYVLSLTWEPSASNKYTDKIVHAYARVPNISADSIVEIPSRSNYLAKYRGSVDFWANSWAEPSSASRLVPYYRTTPWTIPHKMTMMRGKTVLAQPSNATIKGPMPPYSHFSVTARAS